MLSRCWLLLSQWHITTPHAWHSNLQQCCCDENLESCMFCVLFLWISPLVSYPLLVAAPVITSLFPVLPTVLKLKDILLEWSRVIGLYSWLHIGKLSCTISTSSLFPDFYVLLTIHLSIFISVINQLDAQNFYFYNKFISCLYMFRAHVFIIRRSKVHYTASGIITPIGDRLVHRLKESSLNLCTRRPPICVMIPEAV